jgi:hypothetical protein
MDLWGNNFYICTKFRVSTSLAPFLYTWTEPYGWIARHQ